MIERHRERGKMECYKLEEWIYTYGGLEGAENTTGREHYPGHGHTRDTISVAGKRTCQEREKIY